MKLILAVDSIVRPLTGIGRYTWELASHYQGKCSETDSIRFFSSGRWVDSPAERLRAFPAPAATRGRKFFGLPKKWARWNMQREMRGCLFHGPNYFLPQSVDSGIVTVHDLSVFKYPETHPSARIKDFESAFASTLRRAAHLITDSEATRVEIIEYFGWSPERITPIALGVRPEFCVRSAPEISRALSECDLIPGEYSLCVSTLEPRKRIDRLIAAYLDLPLPSRMRYPLVLVGSTGWLSDALHKQIERGEREGWLRYLGFADDALLPLLYSGARAFFYPTIYEGYGLPLLEAMASGVPALTSNCSSLPEVAGGAAYLVEPDDHESLREGIERVLFDESWRDAARMRGLQVANAMTWERCATRTLDLCRRFA